MKIHCQTVFVFTFVDGHSSSATFEHSTTPQAFVEKWMREGGFWCHDDPEQPVFCPWHTVLRVKVRSHVVTQDEP